MKTIALIRFNLLFSRFDDVTRCHLLLCDVTPLLILIENVVLEVSQKKCQLQAFPSLCFELKARKQVFEVPMAS